MQNASKDTVRRRCRARNSILRDGVRDEKGIEKSQTLSEEPNDPILPQYCYPVEDVPRAFSSLVFTFYFPSIVFIPLLPSAEFTSLTRDTNRTVSFVNRLDSNLFPFIEPLPAF